MESIIMQYYVVVQSDIYAILLHWMISRPILLSENYSLERSVKDLYLPNTTEEWLEDHNKLIKIEYKSAHLFNEEKCEE